MKKLKISFQQTVEACYLNLNVEKEEVLDRVTVNVIQQDCPEFLLPLKVVRINGQTALKYRQPGHAVSLAYANLAMGKKDFMQLCLSLILPFVKGRDWFLDYHNLYIDPAYIYIDSRTKAVSYLYLPVQGKVYTDGEILQFFKSLLSKADIRDDNKFLIQLFQYFERNCVTILSLYQILMKEARAFQSGGMEPSVKETKPKMYAQPQENEIQKPKAGIADKILQGSGKLKKREEKRKETKKKEENEPKVEDFLGGQDENDEIMNLMFGDKPAKSLKKAKPVKASKKEKEAKAPKEKKTSGPLFGKLFGGKKENVEADTGERIFVQEQMEPDRQQVFVQPEKYEDDHTVTMDDDSVEGVCCLRLVFSPLAGAPEHIRIGQSQDFITIGRVSRDDYQPDAVFPAEFKGVGRRHARIERKKDHFYIVDLGSVNHTYLDGEVLIPNRPYELKAGCEVAFTSVNPIKYRVIME